MTDNKTREMLTSRDGWGEFTLKLRRRGDQHGEVTSTRLPLTVYVTDGPIIEYVSVDDALNAGWELE